jgi:hypothetical protein
MRAAIVVSAHDRVVTNGRDNLVWLRLHYFTLIQHNRRMLTQFNLAGGPRIRA